MSYPETLRRSFGGYAGESALRIAWAPVPCKKLKPIREGLGRALVAAVQAYKNLIAGHPGEAHLDPDCQPDRVFYA